MVEPFEKPKKGKYKNGKYEKQKGNLKRERGKYSCGRINGRATNFGGKQNGPERTCQNFLVFLGWAIIFYVKNIGKN